MRWPPGFGGQKSGTQALKLAVYAYTPAWIAGVFTILTSLVVLAAHHRRDSAAFTSSSLGLPVLMKNPKEKSRWATPSSSSSARSSCGW